MLLALVFTQVGSMNSQADPLLLLRLQEAKVRVCAGINKHSMGETSQEDPAPSQIASATTEGPQTAGIGSLPGICDVSDDIISISSRSPAQVEQPQVAATHAVKGVSITRGEPAIAGTLPTSTGEVPEVSVQGEVKLSVATAKAPLMEDSATEIPTAAESAYLDAADAGGTEANAAAMAVPAYLAEAQQLRTTEAPADPLAPHSIFASDGFTSRHLGDFPTAAKVIQWSQATQLGSPVGGGQVEGNTKDVQQSPTTPLEWASQSAGSSRSPPTAPTPEGRQRAGFRFADRSGTHSK